MDMLSMEKYKIKLLWIGDGNGYVLVNLSEVFLSRKILLKYWNVDDKTIKMNILWFGVVNGYVFVNKLW